MYPIVSSLESTYDEPHVHRYCHHGTTSHILFHNRGECELYTRMYLNLSSHLDFMREGPDGLPSSSRKYRVAAYEWICRVLDFHRKFGGSCVPPDIRHIQHTLEKVLYDDINEFDVPFGTAECPRFHDPFWDKPSDDDWLWSNPLPGAQDDAPYPRNC